MRRAPRAALVLLALGAGALTAACGQAQSTASAAGRDNGRTPHAWTSTFATGDFTEWSWWGQSQPWLWGHISVVDPRQVGIPAPVPGDDHVARMSVTADDAAHGRYHAKLYKTFTQGSANGRPLPPENVSGTYTAWYYVPGNYTIGRDEWANVFQFKETHGDNQSDPLWWVQFGSLGWARSLEPRPRWHTAGGRTPQGRAGRPVAFLNHWDNHWSRRLVATPVPLNRWFEIRAVVRQGERTDFFLDGRRLDTAFASAYPVSPFRPDRDGWTFGVGDYSTAPGTTLYVASARYRPPS